MREHVVTRHTLRLNSPATALTSNVMGDGTSQEDLSRLRDGESAVVVLEQHRRLASQVERSGDVVVIADHVDVLGTGQRVVVQTKFELGLDNTTHRLLETVDNRRVLFDQLERAVRERKIRRHHAHINRSTLQRELGRLVGGTSRAVELTQVVDLSVVRHHQTLELEIVAEQLCEKLVVLNDGYTVHGDVVLHTREQTDVHCSLERREVRVQQVKVRHRDAVLVVACGVPGVGNPVFHASGSLRVALDTAGDSSAHDGRKVRVLAESLVHTGPQWVVHDVQHWVKDPGDTGSQRITRSDTTLFVDQVRVESGSSVDLLAEVDGVRDHGVAVSSVRSVDHRVATVLLHSDLLDTTNKGAHLSRGPAPFAIDLTENRHGRAQVRADMVLGKAAQSFLVELVRRVEQTVGGDLRHLTHKANVGEVGHDLVDLGVPFISSGETIGEDSEAQRRVAHSRLPRLEHLGALVAWVLFDESELKSELQWRERTASERQISRTCRWIASQISSYYTLITGV
ncbi:hypothetical protein PC116_g27884 [Phytophthora cactorum]|nr:hypothetical protein PC116_g27884 [Phytophthora cactorum]